MTPFKKWLETHNVLGDHSLVWIELALPCWLQFKIENIYLPIFKDKKKQQQQHARILANFLNNLLCPNFSCCPKNLSSPNFLGGAAAPLPPPPGPYAYGCRQKKIKARSSNYLVVFQLICNFIELAVFSFRSSDVFTLDECWQRYSTWFALNIGVVLEQRFRFFPTSLSFIVFLSFKIFQGGFISRVIFVPTLLTAFVTLYQTKHFIAGG